MASTYTRLGVQLMTTGEKAGTWGTLTNTNWNIMEQISGGYTVQTLNTAGTGANTTTLAVSDGSTGAALAHRVIKLTAALAGNVTVTIPLDVQTFYIILNGTTNDYSVEFKYVSGSGSSVTWASGDRGTKIIYATADDATNPNIVDATSAFVTATSTTTLTNKTLTTPNLGTPSTLVLTNATALPAAQVSQGTMASGMVLVAPALGTPASGVMTNVTGTASSLTAGKVTIADKSDSTNYDILFGDSTSAIYDDADAFTYNPGTSTLVVPNINVSGTQTFVDTATLLPANTKAQKNKEKIMIEGKE